MHSYAYLFHAKLLRMVLLPLESLVPSTGALRVSVADPFSTCHIHKG